VKWRTSEGGEFATAGQFMLFVMDQLWSIEVDGPTSGGDVLRVSIVSGYDGDPKGAAVDALRSMLDEAAEAMRAADDEARQVELPL